MIHDSYTGIPVHAAYAAVTNKAVDIYALNKNSNHSSSDI